MVTSPCRTSDITTRTTPRNSPTASGLRNGNRRGPCSAKSESSQKTWIQYSISHAHFDHFGNVYDFPNATFYIQEREISKFVWALSLPERMRFLLTGIDPGDILRGVELARQGRLVCIDGDMENVLPGIDLRAAFDTHTFGSMWGAAVRNDGKPGSQDTWVAGDLAYQFENLGDSGKGGAPDSRYVPIGLAVGSQTNLLMERIGSDDQSRRQRNQAGHSAARGADQEPFSIADHKGRS